MAILDSPESLDTLLSADNGSAHQTALRRRQSVRSVLDPDSNSLEIDNAINDSEDVRNNGNLIENLRVESANQKQERKSSYGKEEANVKENGGSSNVDGTDDMAVKFTLRPAAPAHLKNKESPLSSDAIFKQSHAGLFNLCIVVLVAVNSRLIIENLMKCGWLIKTGFWFSSTSVRDWPLLMCCLSLPVFSVAAFFVEKLVKLTYIPEWVAVILHVIITTTEILFPVVVILRCDSAVQSGVALMLFVCTVWLKLVSYAHTNYDMRALEKSLDKCEAASRCWNLEYSYDVRFKSVAYFMVAPTLCYPPSYPQTACIRKGWVVRQLTKLVIFTGFMGFIVEQYINPIVQNSQHPLKGNLLYAVERVLKLSVPILYVWLCMFYCFFHLWLNIVAELVCFGDREFYKDWWSAKTVEEYWRMWNMPVHKWMVRHIYCPCLQNGFRKVPLVIVTNQLQYKFKNSMVGNMMFWFFFCIYYHDLRYYVC